MDLNREILSSIIVHSKYARFLPGELRRESWEELVARNQEMHERKFPHLVEEIRGAYQFVYTKQVLPSMRSLQFGGRPIELNPSRGYNCSYCPINNYKVFSEAMFLLLGGTGFGYSVQQHHIEQLPAIIKPTKVKRYLVGDSIEGWADAVKALMKSYFTGGACPVFDFSDIRPKGALLVTAGGKAPGPEPLKECLFHIQMILDRKQDRTQLTSLECHDILCFIADAVLAGGIRRAAMCALFDLDDQEMLTCKFGNWYESDPQRARANNSAVILRHRVTEQDFMKLWEKIQASGSGEPGLFLTNDKDMGTNPCFEISLKEAGFCNLCEINASDVESQKDLEDRAKAAALIGTLQASYTDFHYLRDIWKKTADKEALLGVGMTGIASGKVLSLDLEHAAKLVGEENSRVASLIGIRPALRLTTVKPSGTSSLVLGSSSGVHAWHSEYYLRRIRLGKNEALYRYLHDNHPELVEDEYFKPHLQAVVSVPIKAPDQAILRTESPIDTLERVKDLHRRWVVPGHRKGPNTHNVSCTISLQSSDWDTVGNWMWDNRSHYSGISVLPHDGGSYIQAPHEDCDQETYERLSAQLRAIDLTQVFEIDDLTDLSGEAACGAGGCDISSLIQTEEAK